MRQYTKTINEGTAWETKIPIKGVTLIHLFNEVWRIGRKKIVDGKLHSIIYSPEDKEYHVWGKDVENFYLTYEELYKDYYDSSRNTPDPAKVKIYILTAILDDRDMWCFDLSQKPSVGKLTKIIYDNGTIQMKPFSGNWESISIPHNFHMDDGSKRPLNEKRIRPICFRIK